MRFKPSVPQRLQPLGLFWKVGSRDETKGQQTHIKPQDTFTLRQEKEKNTKDKNCRDTRRVVVGQAPRRTIGCRRPFLVPFRPNRLAPTLWPGPNRKAKRSCDRKHHLSFLSPTPPLLPPISCLSFPLSPLPLRRPRHDMTRHATTPCPHNVPLQEIPRLPLPRRRLRLPRMAL